MSPAAGEGGDTGVAAAAALEVAARLGLPAQRARVLHAGSNAVLHLDPVPVVARVAAATAVARPHPEQALGREVALAAWLAERGAPVLPPTGLAAPGPHAARGRWLTLWPLLDLPGGAGDRATGDPRTAGAALAALHAAAEAYPRERLPGLGEPVADAVRALAAAGGWLPARARVRLEDGAVRAGEVARVLDAAPGRRPLHGDAHPRNLLRLGGRGAVLWCDLEDAVTAPVEWDLAVLARSAGGDGPRALAAWAAATGQRPDADLLAELGRLRAWQAGCWSALGAERDPSRRPGVLERLERLDAGG